MDSLESALVRFALPRIGLHRIVVATALLGKALRNICIVLHCPALMGIALDCFAWNCVASPRFALYCVALVRSELL